MVPCAEALTRKNPGMRHHHFDHLQGLVASDALAELLLAETGFSAPPLAVARWRQRLQDALLDAHFSLGQTRLLAVGEPDQLAGICAAVSEAGGKVTLAISSVDSPQLAKLPAQQVLVGDLEDAELRAEQYDVIVGNGHCEALAATLHKGLMLRGFPNWEQVGNQLKNDVLYSYNFV